MSVIRYAGIGHRNAPHSAQRFAHDLALHRARRGHLLSSGAGDGMDAAFENGALKIPNALMEIWLPFDGFNKRYDDNRRYFDVQMFENKGLAESIAISMRGGYGGLGQNGIALMSRNAYQILGHDLNSPVNEVITYCRLDAKGQYVKSGTAVTLKIAQAYAVPIYNLAVEGTEETLREMYW